MSFKKMYSTSLILLAGILGLISGWTNIPYILEIAQGVSKMFVNFLSLISIPLIFLSIVSTISGMSSLSEMKTLGKKVLKYTILTTLIASTTALLLYILINPVGINIASNLDTGQTGTLGSYLSYFTTIIPSNIVELFSSNYNVPGIVFFAILLSISTLSLPEENKKTLHNLFASLFAAILKIAHLILKLLPIGIWAFMTIFIRNLHTQSYNITGLVLYVVTIITANIIQGFIVLPMLLIIKGISPVKIFKAMFEALTVAFFSRSSSTALPITMRCAKENLHISDKVSSFSLPLCSTINMNACAAFILITILFVSASNGVVFSIPQMICWIFIATAAAIGNASVPMGCYFISSAFLASMNVPIYILGAILPIYTLLDMLETAINVWSDSCITAIVDKEIN